MTVVSLSRGHCEDFMSNHGQLPYIGHVGHQPFRARQTPPPPALVFSAAVTNPSPKVGGLKSQNLFSHISGSWTLKIKVLIEPHSFQKIPPCLYHPPVAPGEPWGFSTCSCSLPFVSLSIFTWPSSLCVSVSECLSPRFLRAPVSRLRAPPNPE